MSTKKNTSQKSENFKVTGENLLRTVKELVAEGNRRQLVVTNKEENEKFTIPLTIAVILTVFFPILAVLIMVFILWGRYNLIIN